MRREVSCRTLTGNLNGGDTLHQRLSVPRKHLPTHRPVVSLLAPEVRIPEELPEGWLPADLVIRGFAQRRGGRHWEVVLPEFTIVGVGDSLHEAVDEASDMLFDYFRLCALDEQSFEDSYRPLPARWVAEIAAKSLLGVLMRQLRRRRGGDGSNQRLRLPLHAAH